jgi:F0F1-type ATP synthase alpha subunit
MDNTRARVEVGNKLCDPFIFNMGVKQGDGLSTVLFNLALHQAINKVYQKGTIFLKSSQICAYADDIAIVARNVSTLKEVFLEIEKEAEKMGLIVNEAKAKYMVMSTSKTRRAPQNLKLDNRIFEGISQFKYLGALINSECGMTDCIKDRIQTGNRAILSCLETNS